MVVVAGAAAAAVVAAVVVASNYTISFNYLCENEEFSVFVDWLVCMNHIFVAEKQKNPSHTQKNTHTHVLLYESVEDFCRLLIFQIRNKVRSRLVK